MSLRFQPIIPESFFITKIAYRTRGEVESNCRRLYRVTTTRKAALVSDGESQAWIPKSALVATSEPDILGVRGWYRPRGDAARLLAKPESVEASPQEASVGAV